MKLKLFFLTLFLPAIFVVNAQNVFACTCAPKPPVEDAYKANHIVVSARVASVTKVTAPAQTESYYSDDIRSVTVVVKKVYKSDVRVPNKLVLKQGTGADCVWTFSEKDVGKQFLFYFKRPAEGELWSVSICGRSREAKDAAKDFLYLDTLKKRKR